MDKRLKLSYAAVFLLVAVVVVWYLWPSGEMEIDLDEPAGGQATLSEVENPKPEVQQAEDPAEAKRREHINRLKQKVETEWANTRERLEDMQELLDEGDENGAFELAESFSKTGSNELKSKALDIFRWIGGAESARVSRQMLTDEDAGIAKEAMEVFRQSLESLDADEGYPEMYPMIKDVMLECKDENDLEALFLLVSNLPISDSLNIYMDLQETGKDKQDEKMVEMTKEYIQFVTNGEESINSRVAMEKWLKKHAEDN